MKKYIIIFNLFLIFLNFNCYAWRTEKDKCGNKWTLDVKYFNYTDRDLKKNERPKAMNKLLKKLEKQENVCGKWRSYEDIWCEDGQCYVEYWKLIK